METEQQPDAEIEAGRTEETELPEDPEAGIGDADADIEDFDAEDEEASIEGLEQSDAESDV